MKAKISNDVYWGKGLSVFQDGEWVTIDLKNDDDIRVIIKLLQKELPIPKFGPKEVEDFVKAMEEEE